LKLLIVKFGALGDVVRTSYFLPGLMEKYPDAEIYWYTSEPAVPLLSSNRYIKKLFSDKHAHTIFSDIHFNFVISLDDEQEILKKLFNFNVVVDVGAYFDPDSKNATYTSNSGDWFDMGLLSKFGKTKADFLKKTNQMEHNQIFESILDIHINRPYFFNDKNIEIENFNSSKLDFNIGLNLGAGGRWQNKKLLIKEAVSLVKRLQLVRINEKRVKIYLLGGESEIELNNSIKAQCKSLVTDTGSKNSLQEFAKIISMLDLVVTSDSLALHLSIAQGITSVSFFAPTSAAEIGLFGNGAKVISLSKDYCSYSSDADNSTITAERIMDAISKLDKIILREKI